MRMDFSRLPHCVSWDDVYRWVIDLFIAALILLTFILSFGCAQKQIVSSPFVVKELRVAKDYQEDLEAKFQEVIDYCTPILKIYENRAQTQANKAFWMNVSGLVSGAVMVPMLIASGSTATWILVAQAGLAGWAGSVPFAGQALRESGLSSSTALQTHNEIVSRIREHVKIVTDAEAEYMERRDALMWIATECSIYQLSIPVSE